MQITIFNTVYDDSYTFSCKNIEEGREIIKKENSTRGWKDDDCYSEVKDD